MGQQPRWHATSASGPPAGLTDGGGQDRRVCAAVTGDEGVDADDDSVRSVASKRAETTCLTTANRGEVAPPVLGHRSGHDGDGRRTADGGYGRSSALGGEEGGGDVQ